MKTLLGFAFSAVVLVLALVGIAVLTVVEMMAEPSNKPSWWRTLFPSPLKDCPCCDGFGAVHSKFDGDTEPPHACLFCGGKGQVRL